ncbi:pilus assembly protein TadG-related protein [Nocardioides sp. TF02-7]|uniref:pilus assembly protein TadG-related protein n=1 Tax=Nocardioides sp. TF02-7 TaxID=2917724 RepID=UPI001F07072F|nr:pilus assembly protein TadG-related protein [Nocardioides sp. TF02-7]UMG91066.1 pilus assembly protein TadG-related protein [Nocardioides sp. TF02-7]
MRPRRDDRGAVAVLVALLMPLVLVAGAFAVDLGLQRVARSDMQTLADVVALDLARELDGRTADQLRPAVPGLLAASLARNDDNVGGTPRLEADLGRLQPDGGFQEVGGAEVPTAVRVRADTSVDFAFAGITGTSGGGAARSAIAEATGGACSRWARSRPTSTPTTPRSSARCSGSWAAASS